MHHVYFEAELTDLQQEVCTHHPDLMATLAALSDKDIYMQISAIAVHCNMILHGDYTKEDILKICKTLTKKLVDKRTIHLYSEGGQKLDMTMVQQLPEESKEIQ